MTAPPGPRVEVGLVSPTQAQKWINRNTHNRPVKRNLIRQLAGAIERDEWCFNGETIKFDTTGRLIDGQHRLEAIIEADIAVPLIAVFGVHPAAQETIDTGSRRSLGDVLSLRGESNATLLSSALNATFRLMNGTMQRAGSVYPTYQQAIALLDDHPDIRSSLTVGRALGNHLKYPKGLGAALHYLFGTVSEKDAEAFFERLVSGAGLAADDPIFVLRRLLERRAMDGDKLRQEAVAALTIKAWNAWRAGAPVHRLQWVGGGAEPEPFPTIEGIAA